MSKGLRICEKCQLPMTEKNQPKIEGIRVFQARGRCSYCYQRGLESGEFSTRPRNEYTDTHILCNKCKEWKPVARFKKAKTTASGYMYLCRFCDKLMERYGISSEVYVSLYESQKGLCAICNSDIVLFDSKTHVDHDHSCCASGIKGCGSCVRGLLCDACNRGLGCFRDNIESLTRAVEYLEGNL